MCDSLDVFANKQWLINSLNNAVDDALVGLVKCNPDLALLDIGRIVVQRNHLTLDKVKIISGGSSGHEPSFSGFVGAGMLTAAVQGQIYSSPTAKFVLQTIKELARRHDKGILIIIGNNVSDRLSFGLAMERANNIPNVYIKMIRVADVCNSAHERWGSAGTLLIQKIAGAMAEVDKCLYEIHSFCTTLLDHLSTALVSLKSSVSPYTQVSACGRFLNPKEMEFGSGMHGQVGKLKTSLMSTHETVRLLLKQITDTNSQILQEASQVVVLINNLGNTSKLEQYIFINEVIRQLQSEKIELLRLYSGSFVTSLEMEGFSLTILKIIDPIILDYLDAPCSAPHWKLVSNVVITPETDIFLNPNLHPKELRLKSNRGPRVSDKIATAIQMALNFACVALISCEKQLNTIDSETGDADTGTNLRKGASKISEDVLKAAYQFNWPFMFLERVSQTLENNSDGFLCGMYAIMFEAAAKPFLPLTEFDEVNVNHWLGALQSACSAVEHYGETSLGKLTMYDALHDCVETLKSNVDLNMSSLDAFGLATIATENAARKTRILENVHPDPGAHAVAIWMRAVYEALKLQTWPLV